MSGVNDAARRLFLVPLAHVIETARRGRNRAQDRAQVAGERKFLPINPSCAVILAASAIESTRIALHSFLEPLMGRNLMVHMRSDFTVAGEAIRRCRRCRRTSTPPP